MTEKRFDYKKFYEERAAWYAKDNEWVNGQIDWHTKQIKKSRTDDRKLVAYVWSQGVVDKHEFNLFCKKGSVSTRTKELMNQRAKYYRQRKDNERRAEEYRKKAMAC